MCVCVFLVIVISSDNTESTIYEVHHDEMESVNRGECFRLLFFSYSENKM